MLSMKNKGTMQHVSMKRQRSYMYMFKLTKCMKNDLEKHLQTKLWGNSEEESD